MRRLLLLLLPSLAAAQVYPTPEDYLAVETLMDKEFAETAEDVVWRRSKLGLRLDADEISALDDWMKTAAAAAARPRAAE